MSAPSTPHPSPPSGAPHPTAFVLWTGAALLGVTALDLGWYALDPPGHAGAWMTAGLAAAAGWFFLSGHLLRALPWSAVPRRARGTALGAVALVSCTALLGRSGTLVRGLADTLPAALDGAAPLLVLAAVSLLLRTILPLGLLRWIHKEPPTAFGFGRPTGGRTLGWYVVFLLCVVPLVWVASAQPGFSAVYPLSRGLASEGTMDLAAFLVFQAAYLTLLYSGESFWRGSLLFALERDLGRGAVAFMATLYSVSHWGKPLAETLAATAAGVVLGLLALRHRSFLLGWLLHGAVATAMELAALARAGVTFR